MTAAEYVALAKDAIKSTFHDEWASGVRVYADGTCCRWPGLLARSRHDRGEKPIMSLDWPTTENPWPRPFNEREAVRALLASAVTFEDAKADRLAWHYVALLADRGEYGTTEAEARDVLLDALLAVDDTSSARG